MYTAFSRGFAKKATDINKKDFVDKYTHKVTAKSSNGLTTFELEASDTEDRDNKGVYNDAKITVGVPVDDMFTVSVVSKANTDTEVSTEIKLSDAASATLVVENPELSLASTTMKADINYFDPLFSLESTIKFWDGKSRTDKNGKEVGVYSGKLGAQFAVAFGCPGFEDVSIGVMPAIGLSKAQSPILNMPWAIGGGNKDFQLALTGAMVTSGNDKVLADSALKAYFKVAAFDVGVEIENAQYEIDKYDKFAEKGAKLDAKKAGTTFKIGAQTKISDTTTAKGKVTFTADKKSPPQLDLALKTTSGKSSFAIGTKIVSTGQPTMAFTYALE